MSAAVEAQRRIVHHPVFGAVFAVENHGDGRVQVTSGKGEHDDLRQTVTIHLADQRCAQHLPICWIEGVAGPAPLHNGRERLDRRSVLTLFARLGQGQTAPQRGIAIMTLVAVVVTIAGAARGLTAAQVANITGIAAQVSTDRCDSAVEPADPFGADLPVSATSTTALTIVRAAFPSKATSPRGATLSLAEECRTGDAAVVGIAFLPLLAACSVADQPRGAAPVVETHLPPLATLIAAGAAFTNRLTSALDALLLAHDAAGVRTGERTTRADTAVADETIEAIVYGFALMRDAAPRGPTIVTTRDEQPWEYGQAHTEKQRQESLIHGAHDLEFD